MLFCVVAVVYMPEGQEQQEITKTVQANNALEAVEVFTHQVQQEHSMLWDPDLIEVTNVYTVQS